MLVCGTFPLSRLAQRREIVCSAYARARARVPLSRSPHFRVYVQENARTFMELEEVHLRNRHGAQCVEQVFGDTSVRRYKFGDTSSATQVFGDRRVRR